MGSLGISFPLLALQGDKRDAEYRVGIEEDVTYVES